MQKIIEEVQPTENDVFVDLGSGVGKNFIKLVSILIVSKYNLIVSLLTKNRVSIWHSPVIAAPNYFYEHYYFIL